MKVSQQTKRESLVGPALDGSPSNVFQAQEVARKTVTILNSQWQSGSFLTSFSAWATALQDTA